MSDTDEESINDKVDKALTLAESGRISTVPRAVASSGFKIHKEHLVFQEMEFFHQGGMIKNDKLIVEIICEKKSLPNSGSGVEEKQTILKERSKPTLLT